jgi:hypothetical protein
MRSWLALATGKSGGVEVPSDLGLSAHLGLEARGTRRSSPKEAAPRWTLSPPDQKKREATNKLDSCYCRSIRFIRYDPVNGKSCLAAMIGQAIAGLKAVLLEC